MSNVLLYGTLGCHLCEEAEVWLRHFFGDVELMHVDIAADQQLVDQYGLRIPVLSNGMVEADWPFDVARVDEVLSTRSTSPAVPVINSKSADVPAHKPRRIFLVGSSK
ncbi:glutaredoxin family protein [Marinomonas atlantica]|uniref:glutaredoxin family protein n=1 Tax=Marinomonas atlantica TaxID=1806668 RepID=UPI000832AAD5|nr:glutaredoxin family protein [Marinomonas atlantica]MCO4786954.1 glutaredoxin family protein [Marinomonas atlantica]